MIRPSRPLDVVRYGVFGGPAPGNRAYPLAAVGTDAMAAMPRRDVMAVAISLRRTGVCSLTLSHGRYIPAIVAARPRSTSRCWDVTHLLVDSPDGAACADMLGILFREVSERGGERVFLRLREDDPLVRLAASCGFTKFSEETLWMGPKGAFAGTPTDGIRPAKSVDEHDLFRLYNASTPSRTRLVLGMTLDQWQAARERAGWRSREYVYRRDDAVRGWVQITRRGRSGIVTTMNHPRASECVAGLVGYGASRAWGAKNWYCLVRKDQVPFEALMRRYGFQEVGRYATMARSVASPMSITEPKWAARWAGLNPAVDLSERWQRARHKLPVELHSE